MIPIAILADTLSRARRLAAFLADDDRLDIIEVGVAGASPRDVRVRVVLATGISSVQASDYGIPVVLIADGRPEFGHNTRAVLPVAASASEISSAIAAAVNDLTVLTPEQALRWLPVAQSGIETDEGVVFEELTRRELQILRLIADGGANKEIAHTLGISEHTVKFHVAQILGKLNAGTRTEAVSVGIRRGLIAV